jgi:hypothetical protein
MVGSISVGSAVGSAAVVGSWVGWSTVGGAVGSGVLPQAITSKITAKRATTIPVTRGILAVMFVLLFELVTLRVDFPFPSEWGGYELSRTVQPFLMRRRQTLLPGE